MSEQIEQPGLLYLVIVSSSTNPVVKPIYMCMDNTAVNRFYKDWPSRGKFMIKLADGTNIGISTEVYDGTISKTVSIDELLTFESNLQAKDDTAGISGFDPKWRKFAGEEHQHTEFNGEAIPE